MDPVVIVALSIVLIAIVLAILVLVKSGKKGIAPSDQAFIKTQWKSIEGEKKSRREISAILNADKLLGHVLELLGYQGSVGAKLKSIGASQTLTRDQIDCAWNAHKMRNRVAHEIGIKLSSKETDKTLADFKRTLRNLGARF